MSSLQGRLTQAFDLVRTRVGQLMSEVSETVMGAAVVRAYGLEDQTDRRVKRAIDERYRADVVAHWRAASLFPIATFFYAIAVSVIVALGAFFGPEWGLTFGRVSAFIFLADVFLHVFTDLPEVYAETQTAIAGWRKILTVLDLPVEIVEPDPGVELPSGPIAVAATEFDYAYREGGPVLRGISVEVERGAHVAIVGQTGGGKTTFAKLLARLADPPRARIRSTASTFATSRPLPPRARSGWCRRTVSCSTRRFARTSATGRPAASDRDVETAFEELGLADWVESLPHGLDTPVGERGEALSVGERQLVVARARADRQPGAADPRRGHERGGSGDGTAHAPRRCGGCRPGRTVITIAHRLSTAEHADRVLVLDAGRLVRAGHATRSC